MRKFEDYTGILLRFGVVVPAVLLMAGCSGSKSQTPANSEKSARSIPIGFHLASRDRVEGYRETQDERGSILFVSPKPILTEVDVRSADLRNEAGGSAGILLTFTAEGGKRMHEVTSAHLNQVIAIFVVDELIMSATIKDPVSENVVITGRLTPQRAQEIVDSLNGKTGK